MPIQSADLFQITQRPVFPLFAFARSVTKALTKVITHKMTAHSSEQALKEA